MDDDRPSQNRRGSWQRDSLIELNNFQVIENISFSYMIKISNGKWIFIIKICKTNFFQKFFNIVLYIKDVSCEVACDDIFVTIIQTTRGIAVDVEAVEILSDQLFGYVFMEVNVNFSATVFSTFIT